MNADVAIFIKKITYLCPFFYLFLTVPTTSTNHPYELKWQRQTIPCKSENCDEIVKHTFDSTHQSAVLINPQCSSYVQHRQ